MSTPVTVVGGGVVGLSAAYFLRQDGHEVTLFDDAFDLESGASFGNGGLITPSHYVPLSNPAALRAGLRYLTNPASPFGFGLCDFATFAWAFKFFRCAMSKDMERKAQLLVDLNMASRAIYGDWGNTFARTAEISLKGVMVACQSTAGLYHEREVAEKAKSYGLTVQLLDAQGVQKLETGSTLSAEGGVLFEEDGHMDPLETMRCLRTEVSRSGVKVVPRTWTPADRVSGEKLVLAAGAWTGSIAQSMGHILPMAAGKGYGFDVPLGPGSPKMPTILNEARVAVTPLADRTHFVGTLEVCLPNLTVNRQRFDPMVDSIRRAYPDLKIPQDVQPWVGLRPCTPDGMPYIGQHPRDRDLYFAAGHAMMGMSLGPVSGKVIADLVADRQSEFDLEPLSPVRFG